MSAATTKKDAGPPRPEPVDPEEVDRRIRATNWVALSQRLYRFAFTLSKGDRALAGDLSQEVMKKEWDPKTRKWSPEDFPDFTEHCKARLFGSWRDRGRSGDARYAESYDDGLAHDERAEMASPGASPERLVAMARGVREVFAALRAEAKRREDHVVLAMLDLKEKDGTTRPRDFAEELSMPVQGIYDAMERMARIEEAVAKEFGESVLDRLVGAALVPESVQERPAAPPPPAAWPWRWAWLLAHVATVASLGLWAFGRNVDVRAGGLFLAGAFLPLSLGCAVAWVHAVWAGVGKSRNFGDDGKEISAARMALLLFKPGFNLAWMFRANWLIAEAVEREAKAHGVRGVRGSKRLATAACVATLVPGVNLVVAPIFWLVHMVRCERGFAKARAAKKGRLRSKGG